MAYISKAQVQEKRKLINQLCKEYRIHATVSGSNSSEITVTIRSGVIDFLANHVETVKRDFTNNKQHIENAEWHAKRGHFTINQHCVNHQFSGIALDFMEKLFVIVKLYHYKDDKIPVYFNYAWYIDVKIGEWDKPYELIKTKD